MSIARVSATYYRPFFQVVVAPVELIYSLFLKAIGHLLSLLGANEWATKLQIKACQIDSRCTSLLDGLWFYGSRFLIHANNYQESCRGSCYWLIFQYLQKPERPLNERVLELEDDVPDQVVSMHRNNQIPKDLTETVVWERSFTDRLPKMPRLDSGTYSFRIGYLESESHMGKAHRIAFFKQNNSYLFDPNTGLSEWKDTDWPVLLNHYVETLKTQADGVFKVTCFSHSLSLK